MGKSLFNFLDFLFESHLVNISPFLVSEVELSDSSVALSAQGSSHHVQLVIVKLSCGILNILGLSRCFQTAEEFPD